MKWNMNEFPISFYNTRPFENCTLETVDMWKDLGITLAMIGESAPEDRGRIRPILDRAYELGIKVIVKDLRMGFGVLLEKGEEAYRAGVRDAVKEFGDHPALFGFSVGDEPNADQQDAAFLAVKIQLEYAPHLVPFLNLYPWNEIYGPVMSDFLRVKDFETYSDNYIAASRTKMLSYDCYSACIGRNAAESAENGGHLDFFHNLYNCYMAQKKHGVPFQSICNCFEHSWHRCTREDMLFQLSNAVACGASGIMWFVIEWLWVSDNWRNTPINRIGQRTERFGWLSEVNGTFRQYCGKIMPHLTIDRCYHLEKAYGGFPLFEPFGNVLAISTYEVLEKKPVPGVFSSFRDEEGRTYYALVINGDARFAEVNIHLKEGVKLEKCQMGNRFEPVGLQVDPVTQQIIPGQSSVNLHIVTYAGQFLLFRETDD